MTTRIVMIDHVIPVYNDKGDECSSSCPRKQGDRCQHFGSLALRPKTKTIRLRHANCIRAEERTRHASISNIMNEGDFGD